MFWFCFIFARIWDFEFDENFTAFISKLLTQILFYRFRNPFESIRVIIKQTLIESFEFTHANFSFSLFIFLALVSLYLLHLPLSQKTVSNPRRLGRAGPWIGSDRRGFITDPSYSSIGHFVHCHHFRCANHCFDDPSTVAHWTGLSSLSLSFRFSG